MFFFLPLLLSLQAPAGSSSPPAATHSLAPTYVRVLGAASEQGSTLTAWASGFPQLASQQPTSDWLLVDFHNPGQPVTDGALQLNDGSWLPGTPAPMLEDSPAWSLAGIGGVTALPLDTLWVQSFGATRHPRALEDKDQLWVSTSRGSMDRQRGYLLEWGAEGLLFETAAGERHFPWARIVGLGLLEEQTSKQDQAVWIQLTNGGVLSARILSFQEGRFDLELPWGQHWALPAQAVQRIRRRFDIQELAHADAWQVVDFPASEALDWRPRFGKSVEGRPLRLGTAVFAQGVGVKVPSTLQHQVTSAGLLLLTVAVDGEVEHFRNPQPVVFEVWLEQELLLSSGPRSVHDPPLVLKVRVPKAGNLKLVAKPAKLLPFGGHADFADLVWLPQ